MNVVVLVGRLTRDPEVRYIPESQTAVASFTIAVDREGKDKGADFPKITCFGKTAELVEQYITKGRMIGVIGEYHTGSYKDKEGKTVYTTEVKANKIKFLEKGEKKEFRHEDESQLQPEIPEGFMALEDDDSIPF